MMKPSDIEKLARLFVPYDALLAGLLDRWDGAMAEGDGSHDRSHLMRVWNLVRQIAAPEADVDMEALAVATLFHDCVSVEKNSSKRAIASRLSAEVARALLCQVAGMRSASRPSHMQLKRIAFQRVSSRAAGRRPSCATLTASTRWARLGLPESFTSLVGSERRSMIRTTPLLSADLSTTRALQSTISRPSCFN